MRPAVFVVMSLMLLASLTAQPINAGQMRVTDATEFRRNGSWVSAVDVKPGDIVETYDGKRVRITNVTDVISKEPFQAYGLSDGNNSHAYVLGDGLLARPGVRGSEENVPRKIRPDGWFREALRLIQDFVGGWR